MKKPSHNEDKTLRTFFIYAILVFFLMVVALSVKAFFIIKTSKFDGQHHFTVAFIWQKNVEEIIGFTPATSTISVLQIKNGLQRDRLGKTLAIIPDATVQTETEFPEGQDP